MTEKPVQTQEEKEELGLQPSVPKITKTVWPKASPSGAYYVQDGGKYTLVNPPQYQPAQYGSQWAPGDLTKMPNYEKTSVGERWLLERLPGFAQSNIGKALADFGESWAGKLLIKLDWFAEQTERGAGVAAQWLYSFDPAQDPVDWREQFKSAWYAGSLASDYANTTLEFNDVGVNEFGDRAVNVTIPQDLPGVAGLVEARQEIYRLTQQGVAPQDALDQVRAKSYEKAGALAIRMQSQDLLQHVLGDPLNIIAAWLKPIEKLSAAKILSQGKAVPAEVAKITQETNKLMDAATVALKEAEAAGDVETVTRLTNEISNMQDALKAVGAQAKLGPLEEKFLRIVGAMPGEASWAEKLPRPLRALAKLVTLTPESRAYEYVDNIERNVIAYIFNKAKDPYEAVRSLQRLAAGTLDRQLAHMIVTPQGRMVRGVSTEMAARATQMLGAYDATTFERKLLNLAAVVLQDPAGAIGVMNRLKNGEAKTIAVLLSERIGVASDGPKTLENLLAGFGHTAEELPDIFERLPVLFKGFDGYTDALFRLTLTNMVADVAAEMGVKVFGIKARGTLLAAAEAMKAVETLTFLRVNPAYPFMNWINNDMTMLARGAYGSFTLEYAEGLWKELGFTPPRLRAGIGMSGMAENIVGDSIAKMSRSAEKGSVTEGVTRFADWIKGRNLGKVDMGRVAQAVERRASLRAYTTGYLRGNKMFTQGFTRLVRDFDPTLAKSLGDDITNVVEDAVRSSMTQSKLDDVLLGDNLRLNIRSVLDGASQRLGYDVEDILTPEFTAAVQGEILDAARQGPLATRGAIASIRGRVQSHIDGLVEQGIKNLVQETAAKVQVEGPGAFVGMWSSITDEFYFAHPKHAENVRRITEAIEAAADPKAIDLLWRQGLEAENKYMGRMWNRLEAYVEGMRKGGKAVKLPGVALDEVASSFRKWRSGWQGFFTWRNKTYEEFFGARLRGEAYTKAWADISAEADARYAKLINAEDQYIGRIDNLTSNMLPANERQLYMSYRERVADWRRLDREMVQDYAARMKGLPREGRAALWDELWTARRETWRHIAEEEKTGRAALAGNAEAAATYARATPAGVSPEAAKALDTEYADLNRRLFDAATPKEELPTLRARMAEIDNTLRPAPPAVAPTGVPAWQQTAFMDLNELVPDQMYMGTGIDQLWFTRGDDALAAIGDSAAELAAQRPLKFADLPEELMSQVRAYIEDAKTGIAGKQVASMQFAEFMRDSALLNYNRRFGYNTWLGALAPYEFWFTQSIAKWAMHSLDRPAMLTTYLRMKQFLETAYRPEANLPSRLRGSIRIRLPFLPEWMGKDVFVDPLKMLLPFERFAYPFEEGMNQQASDLQNTVYRIDELVEQGQITRAEGEQAKQLRQGPIWERAQALARQDDAENRKSGFDLMTLMVQPHAPIMWAYNLAKGTPENIGSVFPLTRTIGGLAGALGIDPAGPYNPEAAIRKAIGLHPFDKWDDYRVDRMLSNMAADEDISVETAQLAMAERDKSQNPEVALAYEEAYRRAAQEWGMGSLGSVLGLPLRPYPTGEEKQREIGLLYQKAWKAYEMGDSKAVNRFFEQYPEYEARLALYKEPAERLRRFMTDQLWDKWNSMPRLWQEEAKEQLGPEFDTLFLSKETRGYEMIPIDTLQMWVSMMGGKVPGQLESKLHIALAPRDVAYRAQSFYDTRNAFFPNWFDEQEEYFKLDEGGARATYRANHPLLVKYWDWRRRWLTKNPDTAPYLTDEPPTYGSEGELEQAEAAQPTLSVEEWQSTLGMPLWRLVVDDIEGDKMPQVALDRLKAISDNLGFASYGDALDNISVAARNILSVR